jgi:Holliday junction resolvasome RuvABC endonuclease subunit
MATTTANLRPQTILCVLQYRGVVVVAVAGGSAMVAELTPTSAKVGSVKRRWFVNFDLKN